MLLNTHSLCCCLPLRTFASHIVLTRIYSTPPHASKLEVMRKHNVSRLRQQNLKTEINEMQKTSTMKNIEGDKIIKKNTIEDYSIVEAELSCHVPCAIDNIVLQKSESTNLVVSNMIRKSDGICDDKDDVTFSNNRNTNIVINLDKNIKDQNIDDNEAKEQHKIIKNDANDNRSDIHDDNDDNSCNNSNDNINRKNSNGTIGNTDHEDNSDSINHYSSTKNYDGNNLCDNIMIPISSIAKMNHADKPNNKSTSPSTYKKNCLVKDIQYSDNFNSTLNFSKILENGVENCLEIDKNSHNFDDREISCESLSFDKFDPVNSEIIVKNDVNNNNTETCKVNIIKSEFEICKYADDDCIIKQERIEFEKEFHSNDIDQNFNFKMHEISRQQQMILMTVKKEYELEFEKDELQRILKHKLLRDEMDLNMLRYVSVFNLFAEFFDVIFFPLSSLSFSLCLSNSLSLSLSVTSLSLSLSLSLCIFYSLSLCLSLPICSPLSLSPPICPPLSLLLSLFYTLSFTLSLFHFLPHTISFKHHIFLFYSVPLYPRLEVFQM